MGEAAFENEDTLQRLLAKCPDLMPGELITPDEPRRWLLLARELGIPAEEGGGDNYSLDHLLLDQDGVPTFVEVKRASDTRIRREVVAQMLDYAANATSYSSVEAMRTHMARHYKTDELGVDEKVAEFLGDPELVDSYWQAVKTNLSAARIRLVFVADIIPAGLLRIVEFLNAHTDPLEIIAVEVRQYQDGEGRRMLVPRVLGVTAEAVDRKGTGRTKRQWDEASFRKAIEGKPYENAARKVVDRFLAWAREHRYTVWYGNGARDGSLQVGTTVGNRPYVAFVLYTNGWLETQFQYLSSRPPFDDMALRREYANRLLAIDGVAFPADDDTLTNRRPSIALALFNTDSKVEQLVGILDWFEATLHHGAAQPPRPRPNEMSPSEVADIVAHLEIVEPSDAERSEERDNR